MSVFRKTGSGQQLSRVVAVAHLWRRPDLGRKGARQLRPFVFLERSSQLYIMFLDESGTHENGPCLILAGFAVSSAMRIACSRTSTHTKRVVAKRDIQGWTDAWRQAAGRIGRLINFAEVPLFADSRASRLIQAADLIAYAGWRYYGVDTCDERLIKNLRPVFDRVGNEMHGIIHMTPQFARGE